MITSNSYNLYLYNMDISLGHPGIWEKKLQIYEY